MDIYDLEIERLTANPELIEYSWKKCEPLFKVCKHNNTHINLRNPAGCLTEIRSKTMAFPVGVCIHPHIDTKLTEKIMNDERIPRSCKDIKVSDLPVFAEWQRVLDKLREQYPL